jgi:hypothetical protein
MTIDQYCDCISIELAAGLGCFGKAFGNLIFAADSVFSASSSFISLDYSISASIGLSSINQNLVEEHAATRMAFFAGLIGTRVFQGAS